MGLLDQGLKGLAQKFLGGGSGAQNPLLEIAANLLADPKTGGLNGLVDAFKSKGMNDILSSWISTGQNLPISPDQIVKVLGSGQVQQYAKQFGVSSENITSGLASLLPELIDKLTPEGNIPKPDALQQGLRMLKTDSI